MSLFPVNRFEPGSQSREGQIYDRAGRPGIAAGASDEAVTSRTKGLLTTLDATADNALVATVSGLIDQAKQDRDHTTLYCLGNSPLGLYFRGRASQSPSLDAALDALFAGAF